jgi:hypothetical protein
MAMSSSEEGMRLSALMITGSTIDVVICGDFINPRYIRLSITVECGGDGWG